MRDKIRDMQRPSLGLRQDCVTSESGNGERLRDIMVANSEMAESEERKGGSLTTSCTTRTMRSGTATATTEEERRQAGRDGERRVEGHWQRCKTETQNSPKDPEHQKLCNIPDELRRILDSRDLSAGGGRRSLRLAFESPRSWDNGVWGHFQTQVELPLPTTA